MVLRGKRYGRTSRHHSRLRASILLLGLFIFGTAISYYVEAAYIGNLRQMVPRLESIEFRGIDVIFGDGHMIPNSKWEQWSSGEIIRGNNNRR